jgi:hypothetical protein
MVMSFCSVGFLLMGGIRRRNPVNHNFTTRSAIGAFMLVSKSELDDITCADYHFMSQNPPTPLQSIFVVWIFELHSFSKNKQEKPNNAAIRQRRVINLCHSVHPCPL